MTVEFSFSTRTERDMLPWELRIDNRVHLVERVVFHGVQAVTRYEPKASPRRGWVELTGVWAEVNGRIAHIYGEKTDGSPS